MATIALLSSCQKEVSFQQRDPVVNGQDITGEWRFVGAIAHTLSDITVTDGVDELRTVTVSDYVTTNNSGTFKFADNQFSYTDVSYSIDTIMNVKSYENGVMYDDSDLPFIMDAPPLTASSDYVRNTDDSLTFTNPVFTGMDPSGGGLPAGPTGAILSWAGDTLQLRTVVSSTTTTSVSGFPAVMKARMDGMMRMVRL